MIGHLLLEHLDELRVLPPSGVFQARERLLGPATDTPAIPPDRPKPPKEPTPPTEEEEEVPPLPPPLDIHPPPKEPPLTPPPLPRGPPPPVEEAEGRRDEDRQEEKRKEWSRKEEARKALSKLREQYTEKLKPFEKRSLSDEEWHRFL